jgi:hypothetical protein
MGIATRHEKCIRLADELPSTCLLCNGEEHSVAYEGSKWAFELKWLLDDQDPEAASNPKPELRVSGDYCGRYWMLADPSAWTVLVRRGFR